MNIVDKQDLITYNKKKNKQKQLEIMKTKITFTSELLSNFTNLIFITHLNDGWQTEWELLLDREGEPFNDLNEAIKFVRAGRGTERQVWGVGLSTFQQAQMKNAEWDNRILDCNPLK